MIFDDVLGAVVGAVEGLQVVLLVGRDGMVVAGAGERPETDGEAVAAAYADLLRKVGAVSAEAGFGAPREFISGSIHGTVLWREVDPSFGLVAVLDPAGSLGRARYELGKAAARIRPEL